MRLKELYIDNYKNLKDFTIDFSKSDGLTMIIGNNGCGKSNILEAISSIFHGVYKKSVAEFDYRIEYIIDHNIIRINAAKGNKLSITINGTTKVKQTEYNKYLPENIIAIYSGEEKRLYNSYYKDLYLDYSNKLIKEYSTLPQLNMQYIDHSYWGIGLLVLLLSELDDTKKFVSDQLNIACVQQVVFTFDVKMIAKNKYLPLNSFIDKINPEKKEIVLIDFSELVGFFEYNSEKEIFALFSQATMFEKVKTITNIDVIFETNYGLNSLSEGEKKLILLKLMLHVLANEKTLVMMDEPDAFIHEGRKKELLDMISLYTNTEKIITTHSPTLAKCVDGSSIIMLDSSDEFTKIIDNEKANIINALTNNQWSLVEQNIVLQSNNPLLLVEGKGDVDYINKAISVLGKSDSKYKIKIDILPFGGAANAKHFIKEFKPCINNNKVVIVLFDRDDAGKNAMKINIGEGNREDSNTYRYEDWIYLMLPKTRLHNITDFLIEDYFSFELKKSIAQAIIDSANGYFNLYSKELREKIKADLNKNINEYNDTQLEGFKVLLDKIISIINNEEIITNLPKTK